MDNNQQPRYDSDSNQNNSRYDSGQANNDARYNSSGQVDQGRYSYSGWTEKYKQEQADKAGGSVANQPGAPAFGDQGSAQEGPQGPQNQWPQQNGAEVNPYQQGNQPFDGQNQPNFNQNGQPAQGGFNQAGPQGYGQPSGFQGQGGFNQAGPQQGYGQPGGFQGQGGFNQAGPQGYGQPGQGGFNQAGPQQAYGQLGGFQGQGGYNQAGPQGYGQPGQGGYYNQPGGYGYPQPQAAGLKGFVAGVSNGLGGIFNKMVSINMMGLILIGAHLLLSTLIGAMSVPFMQGQMALLTLLGQIIFVGLYFAGYKLSETVLHIRRDTRRTLVYVGIRSIILYIFYLPLGGSVAGLIILLLLGAVIDFFILCCDYPLVRDSVQGNMQLLDGALTKYFLVHIGFVILAHIIGHFLTRFLAEAMMKSMYGF